MRKFILELRRREVFRTAGLYVGICWIAIEVASVVLPTFDAPEWVLQALIIAAFVGFPVTLVLAWVYDITDKGIEVQPEATDTVVIPFGDRKGDFIVIGVLTVALIISVYLNITSESGPAEELEPVSVLIADFKNDTGDPLFDGLLEKALDIGVESAPHVTSYRRNAALALATRLQPDVEALNVAAARLVAVREGIHLVFSGSIAPAGSGFDLRLVALDPADGSERFSAKSTARSADAVLTAVGLLSEKAREELGDPTVKSRDDATTETFTAASLEAAQAYTTAIDLAYDGKHVEAVEKYRLATELDPRFGRAYSGWALSEFKLGRTEEATELWQTALTMMDTMTERERLRTLGLYYATVTRNYESAVESFSELVEKYPSDAAGRNNLAVSAFLTLDFETASEQGRKVMEIYPNSRLYRANYALYAMYSGEFDGARSVASELIADDPEYGTAYLPLAISHIAAADYDAAADAYRQMAAATASEHTDSLAALGLADLAVYTGRFDEALTLLQSGIEADTAADNVSAAAVKHIVLAEMFAATGQSEAALGAAAAALDLSAMESVRVAAARVFIEAGAPERAAAIGTELAQQLQPQSRAYGQMILAAIARSDGNYAAAVDLLRDALTHADLWLLRFELGRTFVTAGFPAEAIQEFDICHDRRGEATAVFLDDMPSYRHLATLPYWTARAQQDVGMASSATEGYTAFLALRPQGGALADDARQRLP